jgi:hypothetical protein
MIKVDKGIPIPEVKSQPRSRKPRATKYPWHLMEVGDSFLIENTKASIYSQVSEASKRNGRRYITKLTTKGIRVWRIK